VGGELYLASTSITWRHQADPASWPPLHRKGRCVVGVFLLTGGGGGIEELRGDAQADRSSLVTETDGKYTSGSEAGVLKKWSLAGLAKLSRLRYLIQVWFGISRLSCRLGVHDRPVCTVG
jgi:hypothetical protein